MLPQSYFPATLAEKILFIGKAVRVLQSKRTKSEDRLPLEELQAFSSAIIKLQSLQEFNLPLFSRVIELIRECVASRLWNLVVEKASLIDYLSQIKSYFLLAKGEFYQCFIEEANAMLSLPPSSTAEYDINTGPFQATCLKLGIEEDEYIKKLKFRLRSFSFQFPNFESRDGLSCIGSVYQHRKSILRIKATKKSRRSGAVWHLLKQKIDHGFKTTFAFRMRNPLVLSASQGGVFGDRGVNMSIVSATPIPETPSRAHTVMKVDLLTPSTHRFTGMRPSIQGMQAFGQTTMIEG